MEFTEILIECRPDPKGGLLPPNAVLFAYDIEVPGRISPDGAREALERVLSEALSDIPQGVTFDVHSIEAQEGSVILILIVTVFVAPEALPVVGTVGAGAAVLWVAERFAGGFVSRIGGGLADRMLRHFGGDRSAQSRGDEAMKAAQDVAVQRGCTGLATSVGGIKRDDGRHQWMFELVGCDARRVTVIIGRRPPPEVYVG